MVNQDPPQRYSDEDPWKDYNPEEARQRLVPPLVRAEQPPTPPREHATAAFKMFISRATQREVALAGRVFHLKTLGSGQTRDIRLFLQDDDIAPRATMVNGTMGDMLWEGYMNGGSAESLERFMSMFLYEPIPAGIVNELEYEEFVHCFNAFFETSGLRWFEEITRKAAARAADAQDLAIAAALQRTPITAPTLMPPSVTTENTPQPTTT